MAFQTWRGASARPADALRLTWCLTTWFLVMVSLLLMGCHTRDHSSPTSIAGQGRWDDQTGHWRSRDNQPFRYTVWPTNPAKIVPKAVVIAIHGLSGAALDFRPLGTALASQEVITYAYELRGQGNDPVVSRRGDIQHPRFWFADLADFMSLVQARHPDLPVFLYGESMGSLIALHAAVAPPIAADLSGLILASPVVRVTNNMSWWQTVLLRALMRVAPAYRISLDNRQTPPPRLTRDDAYQQWLQQAPHTLKRVTLRLLRHIGQLMNQSDTAAEKLSLPTLVLYAGNDAFVTPDSVELFFDRIASTDKKSDLFPDSYHLLLHDHDHDIVLERIKMWLSQQLSPYTS